MAVAVLSLAANLVLSTGFIMMIDRLMRTPKPTTRFWGTWVVISGVISRVIIVNTHIRGQITPLIAAHEPSTTPFLGFCLSQTVFGIRRFGCQGHEARTGHAPGGSAALCKFCD